MLPPPDGGTWNQLHEQARVKMQSEQITKIGKPEKSKATASITELKDEVRSSERSGLEIH